MGLTECELQYTLEDGTHLGSEDLPVITSHLRRRKKRKGGKDGKGDGQGD